MWILHLAEVAYCRQDPAVTIHLFHLEFFGGTRLAHQPHMLNMPYGLRCYTLWWWIATAEDESALLSVRRAFLITPGILSLAHLSVHGGGLCRREKKVHGPLDRDAIGADVHQRYSVPSSSSVIAVAKNEEGRGGYARVK